jgi:sugar lactone lactonase YvrE
MMNTENRTKYKTGRNIAKHAVAWFALPLLSTQLNAVAPIISPPTTILQVDPGDTLDFQAGAVSTFVGQNTTGFQNGTGTAVRFSSDAQGIAFDNAGNLYITDTSNHRIRKISPSGVVTTFVGSGTAGNVNDTGTAAQVSSPQDIDIDSGGILYVADSGNDAIRTIDASGLVNDLIDNGTGDATGRGWQARFDEPVSIAADRNNNLLYVMDKNNNRIKKIDLGASWLFSTSYCTNFVGDGNSGHIDATGTSARITYGGLALNKNGSILYLADTGNHCIRSINTSTGAVTTLAGSAGSSGDQSGIGTAARFNSPTDVAVDDDGYVYVADYGNNKIKRISPVTGLAMDLAGTGASNSVDGTLFSAQFRSPLSLGYSDEVLYITQETHGRVRDIVKPDHFLVEDIDSATVSVSLAVNDGTLSIDLSGGGSITAGSNGSAQSGILHLGV